MTSGVVAGDAVGGELLGDGERVEHRRQPTTRPARARPAPAARSIWADFEAKAHGRNGRFVAERPVNTGPTPLTDPRLSDPPLLGQRLGVIHIVHVDALQHAVELCLDAVSGAATT